MEKLFLLISPDVPLPRASLPVPVTVFVLYHPLYATKHYNFQAQDKQQVIDKKLQ